MGPEAGGWRVEANVIAQRAIKVDFFTGKGGGYFTPVSGRRGADEESGSIKESCRCR